MKIIIVANFTRRLDGERDGRFSFLMEALADRGHSVELITTDFYHATKSKRPNPKQELYKTKITLCHEPGYKKNVSLRRLYSHVIWGINVGKYIKGLNYVPDIIYSAVPSLTVNKEIVRYCKTHPQTSYIIDIQDIWPDAFTLVLPKYIRWILAPMKWYVNSFYCKADEVVAVSDTYRDIGLKPKSKKSRSGLTVYLGNNGEVFEDGRLNYSVKRNDDEIWLAYIGTLGYSYDIPCVIDALVNYKVNYPDGKAVRFIVIGDGPFKDQWESKAKERGIECVFKGALPYKKMVGLLCSCDIVVNPIRHGAAQSITNKVGDYALSGLPVISTQENPEYQSLIKEYKCGINCKVGDVEEVAKAIGKLANDKVLRMEMGENARKLGLERFDRRVTYMKLVKVIEKQK